MIKCHGSKLFSQKSKLNFHQMINAIIIHFIVTFDTAYSFFTISTENTVLSGKTLQQKVICTTIKLKSGQW